jgi:signal peptidase II
MQKASNLLGRQRTAVFFLTALLVVIADQLTKWWIRSSLDVGEVLWEAGIFQIVRGQNTGSSFGLFQDHSFALAIVAIVGIVFILVYTLIFYPRFFPSDGLLGKLALGLILGGTTGNLIERICHLIDPSRFGGVTDFISIGWWPAFNIADSSIVVGAILFAYSLLLLAIARKR